MRGMRDFIFQLTRLAYERIGKKAILDEACITISWEYNYLRYNTQL